MPLWIKFIISMAHSKANNLCLRALVTTDSREFVNWIGGQCSSFWIKYTPQMFGQRNTYTVEWKKPHIFDTSDIQNCHVLLLTTSINRAPVNPRVRLQNIMNDQMERRIAVCGIQRQPSRRIDLAHLVSVNPPQDGIVWGRIGSITPRDRAGSRRRRCAV